jgi:hypothetical protein
MRRQNSNRTPASIKKFATVKMLQHRDFVARRASSANKKSVEMPAPSHAHLATPEATPNRNNHEHDRFAFALIRLWF